MRRRLPVFLTMAFCIVLDLSCAKETPNFGQNVPHRKIQLLDPRSQSSRIIMPVKYNSHGYWT